MVPIMFEVSIENCLHVQIRERLCRSVVQLVGASQAIESSGQIIGRQSSFGSPLHIQSNFSAVHKQQSIAERRSLFERMGHHEGGELMFSHQRRCSMHHSISCSRVEGRCVFVEQEEIGPVPGRHDERDNLPLATGK